MQDTRYAYTMPLAVKQLPATMNSAGSVNNNLHRCMLLTAVRC